MANQGTTPSPPVPEADRREPRPEVVAVEIGYGHLRPAWSLADRLGVPVLEADRSPVAGEEERRLWDRLRSAHVGLSRLADHPLGASIASWAMHRLTALPRLYPRRDLSRPVAANRLLQRLIERGLGRGLLDHLRQRGRPLVTTHFAPALIADGRTDQRVVCVVTDTEVHRVWVAPHPERSRIEYCVPTRRAAHRLRAYGVPAARVHRTGFPLPGELLSPLAGGPLPPPVAARLLRLDPAGSFRRAHPAAQRVLERSTAEGSEIPPPTVTFTVGGSGAQAPIALAAARSLRRQLEARLLRMALVVGTDVALGHRVRRRLAEAGLGDGTAGAVEVLDEPDFGAYYRRFGELLARTDVLWTKPSELTFYGALGLPLVLAPPIGAHERYNARWALEAGAALRQRDPGSAGWWLLEWLEEGVLAGVAWSAFRRLPRAGLDRIVEMLGDGRLGRRGALPDDAEGPRGCPSVRDA